MCATTLSPRRLTPSSTSMWAASPSASALIDPAFVIEGTGSVFDLSRVAAWCRMLEARVSFRVDVWAAEKRLDLRSASDHLANIRQVLNPTIADLAVVFGVSRQAIYKWIGRQAMPEREKFDRIRVLSHVADALRENGIARAPALLKMRVFEGRSLMDLVAAGQLSQSHVKALIAEAQVMHAAYVRSGVAKSKARPSEDWRTEVSIPGALE